jgi:hypothetical protein
MMLVDSPFVILVEVHALTVPCSKSSWNTPVFGVGDGAGVGVG